MMNDIQSIFDEYTHLRLNGLESSEAINVLQSNIQKLDKLMRNELAMLIRSWETQKTEKISNKDRSILENARQERDAKQAIEPCPNCGKGNPETELICNFCGYLLKRQTKGTDTLPQSNELIDDAIFPYDGVLVLSNEENMTSYTLRPQFSLTRLTIGRGSDKSAVDIDLDQLGGVSRLHATITYDETSETLSLLDMDSTNGSFINEQRLHADERRVIRHGDRLRFGSITLKVIYKHQSP